MMRWRRKASNKSEIRKAVAERDQALADVKDAVQKVDKLKDDLLRQYEEADEITKERS